jgi:membrane protein implicated in regulation of membrane protease activity
MYGEPGVIYRPVLRQLMPNLVVVAIVLVASILLQDPVLTWIAGLGLLIVFIMWQRFGAAVADSGIVVLGLRNRVIPWSAIEDVREHAQAGHRGIVVTETGGQRTLLKAPRDGRLAPDPDYDKKRDAILREWAANR